VRLAEGPTVLGGTAPFCRMSDCSGARSAYATCLPLVELSLVRSHICRRGRGYLVHRGSLRGPVSMPAWWIGSSTVPGAYRYVPVQSSIVPTLLQSSFKTRSPRCAFTHRTTCLGSCPPSDITPLRPSAEPPRLCWRRPRCSQPFDGFRLEARGLVSSRSQIQDCFSFRGLSTLCSLQPSSGWLRPCR